MSAVQTPRSSGICQDVAESQDASLVRLWMEHSRRMHDLDQGHLNWFFKRRAELEKQFLDMKLCYSRVTNGKVNLGGFEDGMPSFDVPAFVDGELVPISGIPHVDLINFMVKHENRVKERARVMTAMVEWLETRITEADQLTLNDVTKKAGAKS